MEKVNTKKIHPRYMVEPFVVLITFIILNRFLFLSLYYLTIGVKKASLIGYFLISVLPAFGFFVVILRLTFGPPLHRMRSGVRILFLSGILLFLISITTVFQLILFILLTEGSFMPIYNSSYLFSKLLSAKYLFITSLFFYPGLFLSSAILGSEVEYPPSWFGRRNKKIVTPILMGAGGALALVSLLFVYNYLLNLFGVNPKGGGGEIPVMKNYLDFFFVLITGAVIAPICEEGFFRGVLFDELKERWGFLKSGFITAIYFAFLHLTLLGFPIIFLSGVIFAYFKQRSKWLLPSIIGHALYNAIIIFLVFGTTIK